MTATERAALVAKYAQDLRAHKEKKAEAKARIAWVQEGQANQNRLNAHLNRKEKSMGRNNKEYIKDSVRDSAKDAGFDVQETKKGVLVIHMADADYTVTITKKKERVDTNDFL